MEEEVKQCHLPHQGAALYPAVGGPERSEGVGPQEEVRGATLLGRFEEVLGEVGLLGAAVRARVG